MPEYTLALSEVEVNRYRLMAKRAREIEVADWTMAGIVEGATVADVGCGPAAVSVELAEVVGPHGRVIAVEKDAHALRQARQMVERAGVSNVLLRSGDAGSTGLESSSVDVAMLRQVLAHNGGAEQTIVDHLAGVVRPRGCVFLVDTDLTAVRSLDLDPELSELPERYVRFHREMGNDPSVGLRLAQLLSRAGLDVVQFRAQWQILASPPGVRPPSWAARDAMVRAGVASEDDVARWGAAFERTDARPDRPTLFIPLFTALGRRPTDERWTSSPHHE